MILGGLLDDSCMILSCLFMYFHVAGLFFKFFVWGGLGVCLRMMVDDDSTGEAILEAEYVEEASS